MTDDESRARVIVAEDDEPARELLTQSAQAAGWRDVHAVATAEQALDLWRAAQTEKRTSILLLDVFLPRMSGIDAAEVVLGEESGQLVILVSARLDEDTTRRARAIGVHACVSKSQVTTELPTMLATWAADRSLL